MEFQRLRPYHDQEIHQCEWATVMRLDWSFSLDHSATVKQGERNATLVEQPEAWHLRIKYDPPIITGEHWDVLIAWEKRYSPSFTEALIKSSDILKQEWEITN
jgi:hypothetical protein